MWSRLKFVATHRAYVASVLRGYLPILATNLLRSSNQSCPLGVAYLDVQQRTNRSLFNLVWIMEKCGYRVLIPHEPVRLSQMGFYDKWMFKLPQVRLTRQSARESEPNVVITDRPAEYEPAPGSSRVLELAFHYFRIPRSQSELPLPLGCHPRARMMGLEHMPSNLPTEARGQRLFFAGNFSSPDYKRKDLPSTFGILNRHEFMQVVSNYLENASDSVKRVTRIVDQGPNGRGLPLSEYFSQLEHSSFALCPPGVNHPQCHNLEEAMLRGAVPVLEYGQLLAVPLSDGENSIAFRGVDGLRAALDRIFSMTEMEISQLRGKVREYARAHLAPAALLERLASDQIERLLLLNEAQSARL